MRLTSMMVFLVLAACSTEQKKEVTEEAYQDPARRREIMEATLRVMDANPEYVDEFFAMTRKHPKTRDRFFGVHAAALDEGEIAERTAAALVRHPDGLRRVMIATLDKARDQPEAREAIIAAMKARADLASEMVASEGKDSIKDKVKDLVD